MKDDRPRCNECGFPLEDIRGVPFRKDGACPCCNVRSPFRVTGLDTQTSKKGSR